jgi:hypothetical protein
MPAIFSFKCSCCGNIHEGSPSFSFNHPQSYSGLSDSEKEKAHLSSDFCVIDDDRFIRVCLEIPIIGVKEPFMWGIWVSLSQENFERYNDTYDLPVLTDEYFGWFCNELPYYSNTLLLKTMVHPRAGGTRPYVELEPTDHPLFLDYHHGISIEEAQKIAEFVLHSN